MAEEQPGQPKPQAVPQEIVLTIKYDVLNKRVFVGGPISLKTLCVIALSSAIQVVAEHRPPVIIPASGNGKTPHLS